VDATDRVEGIFRRLRQGIGQVLDGKLARSGAAGAQRKLSEDSSAAEIPGAQVIGFGKQPE
jgi:hypothetical protein